MRIANKERVGFVRVFVIEAIEPETAPPRIAGTYFRVTIGDSADAGGNEEEFVLYAGVSEDGHSVSTASAQMAMIATLKDAFYQKTKVKVQAERLENMLGGGGWPSWRLRSVQLSR
jgi:hypothetical protein